MSRILHRPRGLIGDLASEDLNDACCWACSGGGDVLCCDGCRAVYHLACIGLKQLPEDDFFCPLCQCKSCGKPCRSWADPLHINTQWVEVKHRQMQPRLQASQPLPSGPGYLCPQQMRSWLQQQPGSSTSTAHASSGSSCTPTGTSDRAAAAAADATVEAHTSEQEPTQQPKFKRHKGDDSSSTPAPPASSSSTTAAVRCCCCQSACHIACLPAELRTQYNMCSTPAVLQPKSTGKGSKAAKAKQQQQEQQQQQQHDGHGEQQRPEPYFCSPNCRHIATQLAQRCAQGVVQVGSLVDGTPVAWQLIQAAGVAAALGAAPTAPDAAAAARAALAAAAPPTIAKLQPDSPAITAAAAAVGLLGSGAAARFSVADAAVLAQVLRDALQLLLEQLGPAWEVRTFQDTLPWLLGGLRQNTPAGLLDLSHFHVAVLWVGSTLAAAALVRVHGPAVLEVCLAATQAPLQRQQLGRALMACVERFALETLGVQQAWMPALGGVVKPCVGLSVLPTCEQECGARDGLVLAPHSSVVQLGLAAVQLESSERAATAASAAARESSNSGSSEPEAEGAADAKPQSLKDLKACWALQLRYGPAPSVVDWLQLPKYALVRYSYVPFVTKRLSPETLVPLPSFRKKVRAGPAASGKAKAEATAAAVTAAGAAAPSSAQPAKKLLSGAAGSLAVQQLPLQRQQQGLMQAALQQATLDLPEQQQQQQPQSNELRAMPSTQQQQHQAVSQPQFNFLSAQQLVDMTRKFNAQHSAAGGIAAGIAAYNSSKRKGAQLMQQQGPRVATGVPAAGRFGVGGVVL